MSDRRVSRHLVIVDRSRAHPRLGWFHERWDTTSWEDEVWAPHDPAGFSRLLDDLRADRVLGRAFARHLPRSGPILEGGCGLGQWVVILRERGYDVVGVEIGEETARRARLLTPGVPVHTGDILRLEFPDGHFAAYISLGVMEHFEEGPDAALREAWRVLRPGGVLLCSVPWMSAARRLRRRPSERPSRMEFYQWGFTTTEWRELLAAQGFRLRAVVPYAPVKTLRDELPAFRALMARARRVGAAIEPPPADRALAEKPAPVSASPARWAATAARRFIKHGLLDLALLRRVAGHMQLAVAVKG